MPNPIAISRRALVAGTAATAIAARTPRALAQEVDPLKVGVIPQSRVLVYYGFPGNPYMGILGEYEKPELLRLLQDQAAEYEAADPSRPIQLAFEIIASVAQADPLEDGMYLLPTGSDIIEEYVTFTRDNGLLLFLDLQFGQWDTKSEIDRVREWLREPHVHLALDPEFSVLPGEAPGQDLGSIDAEDVAYAQRECIEISRKYKIPRKILIVHQFHVASVTNKDKIEPMLGVDLIIDADGFGTPAEKASTYQVIIGEAPIEFNGFKLFYRQDDPLMSASDVLGLSPSPDLIIYQ